MKWLISHPVIEQAVKAMFISPEAYEYALNSACEWAKASQSHIRLIGYGEVSVTGEYFEILVRACDVAVELPSKEETVCSCD